MKKPVVLKTISDKRLVTMLAAGCVGVMPTDTQYGLVASVLHPHSIQRLYQLKERTNQPGTLLAAHTAQLPSLGMDEADIARAARFWPGKVSVVLDTYGPFDYLHLGGGSLAVRIPEPADLRRLLKKTGILQTSSANLTGQPPASTIEEAQSYFGSKVDFYVDGGDTGESNPSTVIRIHQNDEIAVLRQGAVNITS